jgi:citrate lyase beta subunit
LKYFRFLCDKQQEDIFFKKSITLTKLAPRGHLAYGLGGALYIPGNREDIAKMIISKKYEELCTIVLCLEDAIGDLDVFSAENKVIDQIKHIVLALENSIITFEELPLIFIRVRSVKQMEWLAGELGMALNIVTGFVFPKFSLENAKAYLESLTDIVQTYQLTLYAMPILETVDLLYKEKRIENLTELYELVSTYEKLILNIRIGATDLCGLYGIRRNYNTTIYDIAIIRDLIGDIINFFGRKYVISGPVWEYFGHSSRILKPQLRQTPFQEQYGEAGLKVRSHLLDHYLDGLIKETLLDLANGLDGKTVIHPSHLRVVQGLNVISKEDYLDAKTITEHANGSVGVMRSEYLNKMNEIKPHLKWANKIMLKSEIYGVYNENKSFIDLLTKKAYITNS